MIKYDNSTINDWNFGDDNIAKVYYGVTESSRLPNGYTEVEYISNYSGGTATPTSTTKNGLAYIDTNFIPTEKTRTVADLQITQASQNPRYFGSGKWNSLGYMVSQEWTVGESRARIYCKYGQSSGWIQTDYVPTMDRHVYDLNKDGKLLIDNVEIATLPTTSFTCATSMAIFTATRANDTYVDLGETVFGRCYSFKIYEDGILVRDFVPCTRDSDSKAGMYDIVNDVFYSSGNNNNLYAGNAIYPSTTVGNVVYQKITTGSTPPTPPTPYTELEYIQLSDSTNKGGIQLLNTPKEGLLIEIDFELSGSSSSGDISIIGQKSQTETVSYQMGFMQHNSWDSGYYDYGGGRYSFGSCPSFTTRRTWKIGRISGSTSPNVLGFYCDGTAKTTTASLRFDANCPYILGNINYNGSTIETHFELKQLKVYSVKIYEDYGETLVGNYIPVLTENNVATLYDSISDDYATTYGTIVAGPTIN